MKLDGNAHPLEAWPAMESFQFLHSVPGPSFVERARSLRPPRSDRPRLNRELEMKAEELEKLYADHKLRRARSQLAEGVARRSSERSLVGELVEFDGDLLLKMVDDLEYNMKKLSRSEIHKGGSYAKYVEKRDAKLREELGSKGAQKRAKMKMIEDKFEESWAQMKPRCRQDSAIRYREQEAVKIYQNEEENLHKQIQSSNETLQRDGSLKRISSRKLLSSTNVPSTTLQTSVAPIPRPSYRQINPDSTREKTQARRPSAQSLPNFSYLRKENMKPPTRMSKGNTPLQPRTCVRSKSTANFGELKDLTSVNSYHNSNIASSKLSKQQSQKTITRKIQDNESKTVLRRASGVSTDTGTSIVKLRDSTAFEIQQKEDESEDMLNQQTYAPELIEKEDDELKTGWIKERASIFHLGSDSEEPRPSQLESGMCDIKSEKYDILKNVEEADNGSAATSRSNASSSNEDEPPKEFDHLSCSNINHSESCVHVASSHRNDSVYTPIGSPATWNSPHSNIFQEVDVARKRKKWGVAEKPNLATNTSDQLLKDVAKQLKKFLTFGRKGKSADGTVNTLACSSSASGGDDDTDDGHEVAKISSDDLKKSSNGHVVGLREGKIFLEQIQSPSSSFATSPENIKVRKDHQFEGFQKAPCVFSFLSFHGRGSESKLK